MPVTRTSKSPRAVWSLAFWLLSASVHVSGQGLYPSQATVLGSDNVAQTLLQQYSSSRAWRRSYKLSPKSACRSTAAAVASPNLCAPSPDGALTYAQTAQLLLATSPQAYSSIDPRQTGGLNLASPVGNQDPCNTCTAFAVTSAAEMAVASVQRVDIQQISYSPQSLYYCSGIPRDCSTGWTLPEAVQQFSARSRLIPTAQCLPYRPDPQEPDPEKLCQGSCAAVHPYAVQGQFSFKQISSFPSAQQHIRQYGGVVSRFQVYGDFRRFFANKTNAKQVYKPNSSAKPEYEHAVLLVGYDNEKQYWLAKNSWGAGWGDGGYFRVAFDTCSILTAGSGEAYGLIWSSIDPWKLPVTSANTKGCYWYTAKQGDSPSRIAAIARIPLMTFMLNNTANIKDLDSPLAGTKLLLCNPVTGTYIDSSADADTQLVALQRLKAFVDTDNTIKDWTVPTSLVGSADASSGYCKWSGVTCKIVANSTKRLVWQLALTKNAGFKGLHGVLPPADVFRAMPGLEVIDISQQDGIGGTIPSQWSQLEGLIQVIIADNSLSGVLPDSFGGLSKLKIFSAWGNKLHGTLPGAYGALSGLTELQFSHNHLSGSLPESWAALKQLSSLGLYNNSISGTIPGVFAEMASLKTFILANNRLNGPLPGSWALTVESLSVANNSLIGTLPDSYAELRNLRQLVVWGNKVGGTLPDSYKALENLEELGLSDNFGFVGTLPASWAALTKLRILAANNNSLTGTLLDAWAGLASLQFLLLQSNRLTGLLPSSWGTMLSLRDLELSKNALNGTLPVSYAQLINLQVFYAWSNKLSGTLPEAYSNMTALQLLDVSANTFRGTLPSSWYHLASLNKLKLQLNQLDGPLPALWSGLESLSDLDLDGNQLTGLIPNSWGQGLNAMMYLRLGSCNLAGTLPRSLGHMESLSVLNLHDNNFTGTIPTSWADLSRLAEVYLFGNRGLKGCIPRAWSFSLPSGVTNDYILAGTQLTGFCGL